jgi:hypothetical protein
MASYTQLVVAIALLTTVKADHGLRSKKHIVIEGGTLPSQLNLRLCNAFTDTSPVAVVLKPAAKHAVDVNLTKHDLLQYKACRDWPIGIQRGDTLEFEQHGGQLGAFAVTAVPTWDATLLLIFTRKATSARPKFISHVFSKTDNAQVAVLDMYNGPSKRSVVIEKGAEEDTKAHDKKAQKGHELSVLSESLMYDSVVAVSHGNYMCALDGNDGTTKHPSKVGKIAFNVVAGTSYVVMRVGTSDKKFPEELVVFPSSASYCLGGLSSMMIAVLLSLLLN